jgi:hypothetical protein
MAEAETLASLGGVALFLAAGMGIIRLLPGLRALPWAERLAYAYLLGIAWVAGSLYALSHAFNVPLRRPAILAMILAPVLTGLFLARPARPRTLPARRRSSRAVFWVVLLVAAAVSAGLMAEALTNPLRDWDGRMTWAVQARWIHAEGTVDARVLREPWWFVTHPQYPVLMPLAQVVELELFRLGDDAHVYRALYAAFLPAFLALLYGGARRYLPGRVGGTAAALTVLTAVVLPFLTFFPGGGAVSAYSDLPLACFYGGALLLLLRPRPGRSEAVAAGLLLGAAALAKNEGAPLALTALLLAGGAALWRRRRPGWRRRLAPVAIAAVPVLLALALLVSWRSDIPNRFDEEYDKLISAETLWPEVVTRLPWLVPKILEQMLKREDWSIFWMITPVVFLAGWRGLRRRVAPPLALAALAPLGVAWLALTVSLVAELLVSTAWNRFLVQASLPFFLLFAFALDDLIRRAALSRSRPRSPRRSAGTDPAGAASSGAPDLPPESG